MATFLQVLSMLLLIFVKIFQSKTMLFVQCRVITLPKLVNGRVYLFILQDGWRKVVDAVILMLILTVSSLLLFWGVLSITRFIWPVWTNSNPMLSSRKRIEGWYVLLVLSLFRIRCGCSVCFASRRVCRWIWVILLTLLVFWTLLICWANTVSTVRSVVVYDFCLITI